MRYGNIDKSVASEKYGNDWKCDTHFDTVN